MSGTPAQTHSAAMHPRIQQLVEQLQWHATVEGETLDEEYCQSLNPNAILNNARRAGLQIADARSGVMYLRDAKIGDSVDCLAAPLLTKGAFRLFSSAVWAAFQDVRRRNCTDEHLLLILSSTLLCLYGTSACLCAVRHLLFQLTMPRTVPYSA